MKEQDQTGRAADRRLARVSGVARAEATAPTLIDRMRALFGLGSASIRDDIEEALDDAGSDTAFTVEERAMLRNVLGLHELRVEDIMVPRADVIAVGSHMTLGEVLAVFRAAGHSRLPVHGDTLDDPRGMIHIRDFVDVLAAAAGAPGPGHDAEGAPAVSATFETPVAESGVTRPVLFAPPSMQALDLLVKMQASRTHMALVIDEYGGTDGLVTIEDIVEMIVGDIEDEHDEDEAPLIVAEPDGTFVADGRASLEEVSAAVSADLGAAVEADDIETIGGLVATLCGRLPLRGEIVEGAGGVQFEVLDADPRRIKRVRIRRDAPPPDVTARPASEPA